jgi:sortase (surface protein transpeptidase)
MAFIGLGGLLAAFAASYLIYAQVARSRLDRLDASVPDQVRAGWTQPSASTRVPIHETASTGSGPRDATPPAAIPGDGTPDQPDGGFYRVEQLYPASSTNPKYWDTPLWSGSEPYGGPGLPEGFDFVSSYQAARRAGSMERARRILIPAIGVNSAVQELGILDLGDSRAYATPAFVVGHIPGTSNPGENGNGWYFGHLESPFVGEGNVFYRLPEIARLIKEDPVDVIIEGDGRDYLYRVIATKVVHQDAVSLFDATFGTVTLVACVPSRVYDHRLLVTAQLIAERAT